MASEKKMTQPVLSQSLFSTAYVPPKGWRSYATSTGLHALLILALLSITFPAIQNEVEKKHIDNVTLIAPQIPRYEQKIPRPPHIQTPQPPRPQTARNEPKPTIEPLPKPAEVKPVVPEKPVEIAAAPEIKVTPVAPPTALPETKQPLPPAPKPAVRTGAFQNADAALAPRQQNAVKVGGFGDPNGVPPSPDARSSAVNMARVGSFDLPPGGGNSGGGGRNASGGVHQTSFGSAGEPGGVPGGTGRGGGTVHTGGFGDGVSTAAAPTARAKAVEPAFTPVEILSKPKPTYTEEARSMKLEGEVSLQVVFESTGSVRIIRVTHGLGHGLDEAAEQAALHVRFRPATRGGTPVDSSATIHITFQLT